jgi:hypothetical protein
VGLGFGVLGLGYWAQSPIPNPQSPIPNPHYKLNVFLKNILIKYDIINIYIFNKNIILI